MATDHAPGKHHPGQCRRDTADFATQGGKAVKRCACDLGLNDRTPSKRAADRKRGPGVGGTAGPRPPEPGPGPGPAAARKRVRGPETGSGFSREAAAWFARGPAWAADANSCPMKGGGTRSP